MKKLIAICLILSVAALFMTSCSEPDNSKNGGTLVPGYVNLLK